MAYSDRELLARIIQCEAGGEGDNGMKAVATVIMNRAFVSEGEYLRVAQNGNIRNIIFQPQQFDCATDTLFGKYNPQNIYNMNPTEEHYYIADWALSGNKLNEIGNSVILGHNYRNGTLFAKIGKLSKGASIFIKDANGREVEYKVYKVSAASAVDSSFYSQDTNGKREITLSTCNKDGSARTIVQAMEK